VVAAAVAEAPVAAADLVDRAARSGRDLRGRLVLDVVWPCRYLVSCAKSVETTSSLVLKAKNSAGM
jgi:hypothetical protein